MTCTISLFRIVVAACGVFVARLVSWCVFWKGGWPPPPSVLLSGITACCIGLRDRLRVTHLTAACVRCVSSSECLCGVCMWLWRARTAAAGIVQAPAQHIHGPAGGGCAVPLHCAHSMVYNHKCNVLSGSSLAHMQGLASSACVCARACVWLVGLVGVKCPTLRRFWVVIVLYSRHG